MIQKLESTRENLTVMVYSDCWTYEMEFVYQISQKLKLNYLWLRPLVTKINRVPIKYRKRASNNRNRFKIETKKIKDHYSTPVMFEMLKSSVDKNSWIFRLDNDEIISEKSLRIILNSLPMLNKSVSYSLPRLWVNKFGKNWKYSSVAITQNKKYDLIFRLFTIKNVRPATGIHSGGLKFKKTKELQLNIFILHLIYLRENLETRCKKVAGYEAISPGSGHSKIRHYIPEIFPSKIWQSLPKSECNLLNSFENLN